MELPLYRWMVYFQRKSQSIFFLLMDDDWGYPHVSKPPYNHYSIDTYGFFEVPHLKTSPARQSHAPTVPRPGEKTAGNPPYEASCGIFHNPKWIIYIYIYTCICIYKHVYIYI